MPFDIESAKSWLNSVELPERPPLLLRSAAPGAPATVFDEAKAQAQVAGSGVFSFAQGVDACSRQSISDSALLAQLVANKQTSASTDPLAWFEAYSTVLGNIGWVMQESGWTDYSTGGDEVEVNEKVVDVMTAVLGPGAGALSILTATVNALKAMQPGSSWFTVFNRECEKASLARFQIGLVDKDPNGDMFVSLIACVIEATSTITQVLFFKYKDEHASFRANTGKVSINAASLAALEPVIQQKILAYQMEYLSSIQDL